jgi:hypothetical protein
MKKLVLFLVLFPILSFSQNYSMATVPIGITDVTNTYMGYISGSISITNNVLTVNFSGGWNPASMKLGIVKPLNISPPLPDIDLGPISISSSNKQSTGYSARIVNNNFEIYSYYGSQPIISGCYLNFTKTYPASVTISKHLLAFEYDMAGNQVHRFVKMNTPSGPTIKSTTAAIAAVNETELLKFFPEDVISYYPNPVKEELFLKWELINDNAVHDIQVLSLSGQLMQTFSNLQNSTTQNIPFQIYPNGVYLVVLNYKDGNQKSIKIVKGN